METAKIFGEAGIRPRPGQLETAEKLREQLEGGNDTLLIAPTGWGKTFAILAALRASLRLPALWLVRSLELAGRVREDACRLGLRVFVSAGRARTCAYAGGVDDVDEYCRLHRVQCPFFTRLVKEGVNVDIASWEEIPRDVCRYYGADVVALHRDLILQSYYRRWSLRPSAVVVDEAHNLVKPRIVELGSAELRLALDELVAEDIVLAREVEEALFDGAGVDRVRLLEVAESVAAVYRARLIKRLSKLGPLVRLLKSITRGGVPYREGEKLQVFMPPWRPLLGPRVYVSATIPSELEKAFGARTLRVPADPRPAFVTTNLTTRFGEETVWGYFKLLAQLKKRFKRVLVFTTERVALKLLPIVEFYEERLPTEWQGIALYNVFGRFAEGVDISADAVAVVGCPFLPPDVTEKFRKYYFRLGVDPEAAHWVPMVTATLQAIGRASRAPEARPTIVLADVRFYKYERYFEPILVFEEYQS